MRRTLAVVVGLAVFVLLALVSIGYLALRETQGRARAGHRRLVASGDAEIEYSNCSARR